MTAGHCRAKMSMARLVVWWKFHGRPFLAQQRMLAFPLLCSKGCNKETFGAIMAMASHMARQDGYGRPLFPEER